MRLFVFAFAVAVFGRDHDFAFVANAFALERLL